MEREIPRPSCYSGSRAGGPGHHVSEGEVLQLVPDLRADLCPDGQQDALALVVARPVLMGLAEVPGDDRSIDGCHDLGEGDLVGLASEDVPPADPALGPHEARALECEEDLLEVGLGEGGALGDVAHRGGRLGRSVQGEGEQRSAGVVTPG